MARRFDAVCGLTLRVGLERQRATSYVRCTRIIRAASRKGASKSAISNALHCRSYSSARSARNGGPNRTNAGASTSPKTNSSPQCCIARSARDASSATERSGDPTDAGPPVTLGSPEKPARSGDSSSTSIQSLDPSDPARKAQGVNNKSPGRACSAKLVRCKWPGRSSRFLNIRPAMPSHHQGMSAWRPTWTFPQRELSRAKCCNHRSVRQRFYRLGSGDPHRSFGWSDALLSAGPPVRPVSTAETPGRRVLPGPPVYPRSIAGDATSRRRGQKLVVEGERFPSAGGARPSYGRRVCPALVWLLANSGHT